MASTQPVVKFTYEDYLATPDDERYELLDGDLIMVAAPNLKHQRVSARLHTQMGRFIEDRALGTLLYAPCDVVLSDTDVVQPDLLFVSREREHLLSDGEKVRGAPDPRTSSAAARPPSRCPHRPARPRSSPNASDAFRSSSVHPGVRPVMN